MDSQTWAVVVARVGPAAKSRLATALDPRQRQHLALAMLADVLAACTQAPLAGLVGVVDSPAACRLVSEQGGLAVLDEQAVDMNAAIMLGIQAAVRGGARAVLILPGDVPLISTDDVRKLLEAPARSERAVVLGTSRDGQGTNALLLRPPDIIAPSFGPPSVERHLRAGLGTGAFTVALAGLGLALDVDTPADLALLRKRQAIGHTAAVLAHLSGNVSC